MKLTQVILGMSLLATAPWLYAQRQGQWNSQNGGQQQQQQQQSQSPQRGGMVDRVDHGSLRHMETAVVPRSAPVYANVPVRRDVVVHRDVEADYHRPRYWNNFAYGSWCSALPYGWITVPVAGVPYYYYDGIYYQSASAGYQEVYPPLGATIPQPPDGSIVVNAGNLTYYYAGGAFYVQQDNGFIIAPPPIGVTVPELPPGAAQVSLQGRVAYQFDGIYYQPVFINGVTQYVTVQP